ncbi:MAG: hypothetical protein HZB53_00380 [Chloroflexi bacterium]|nr:hypothetical protein [Chloroflexota bacterium]
MKHHFGFAVLVAAVAAVILVITQPAPAVQALPGYQSDCSSCHGSAGSYPDTVGAVPSAAVVAPGAPYNVAISMSPAINGASGTGYWIANSTAGGSVGASTGTFAGGMNMGATGKWNAAMTAPTTPGTYYYIVFGQSGPFGASGSTGYALYSIVVGAAATSTPTNTPLPPTATSTNTPLPPTATSTNTPLPPNSTATATNTPVPPSATSTNTAVPPNSTATATNTSVPPSATPTATATRGTATAQPTKTPTPAKTPPPPIGGRALFSTLCAACHLPSSPAYVGKEVCDASASDIREAINEVPTMQFLKGKLSKAGLSALASYLKTLPCGDDDTPETHPTKTPTPVKRVEPTRTPTPVKRAEPTKTPTPVKRAEPTRTPTSVKPAEPTRTPVPSRTAVPTSTPPPTIGGRALFDTFCATCHTPGSPAFVGKTVCGDSASDIQEAINEVPTMQFLKGKLSSAGIYAIASYLKTQTCASSTR